MVARRVDTRGVTTAVSYTLALGITAVLVGGLMLSMGGMMDGQRDRAVDAELRIVGEGLAVDLVAVDRTASSDATYVMQVDTTTHVAGEPFTVTLRDEACPGAHEDANACLAVETTRRSHTVGLTLTQTVDASAVSGGSIAITAVDGTLALEEGSL